MVGDNILVDNAKIITYANIWWSGFGCNSDVGCYGRCRRNVKIGTETVEFFLCDFKDCRRNLSLQA